MEILMLIITQLILNLLIPLFIWGVFAIGYMFLLGWWITPVKTHKELVEDLTKEKECYRRNRQSRMDKYYANQKKQTRI